MRGLITILSLGLLAACLKAIPPGGNLIRCPDSADCTQSNGTGVYFAEDGAAGLGPMRLMITHFINGQSGLRFQGRFFDTGSNTWRTLSEPGTVFRADLPDQANLAVVSLSESDTLPVWTLQSGSHPAFQVTAAQLQGLRIYINFGVPVLGQTQYILDFGDPVESRTRTPRQAMTFRLRWRPQNGAPAPAVYCTDASGAEDPVVFQQGIDVDPVKGTVTANPDSVTMSCLKGAPATVYRWDYDYRNTDLYYFSAGIHMKRAAYCGDERYFTRDGTEIEMSDNLGRNSAAQPDRLEAWWTPTGASCVNRDHVRHGDIVRAKKFTWSCPGSSGTFPPCQTPPGSPPAPKYLVDSPLRPIP